MRLKMLCAFANAHSFHSGSAGGRAFRDLELEQQVLALTQRIGIGAQFGGKYFCHDVRVIRLPRHGASCPVGIGVSCSADRQALGKITADGVFLEELERDPSKVCVQGGMSSRLTNVAAC
jgi:fumarate hydratase, class I